MRWSFNSIEEEDKISCHYNQSGSSPLANKLIELATTVTPCPTQIRALLERSLPLGRAKTTVPKLVVDGRANVILMSVIMSAE